jgi:hypothetical protein
MKPLILFCSLILQATVLFSQTDNLFWFAAPDVSSVHGNAPQNGSPINLHVTAEAATTVTISQPANPSFTPITFQLGERELRSIRLDTFVTISQIENYPTTWPAPPGGIQNKAFKITSEPGKIAVYYELDNTYNRELFTLKGSNALGKEFYVSTQNFFPNGNYSGTAWSGFVIASTEDNTRIVVFPNDDWYYFDTNPGDSIVLMLNAGETFAFRAASVDASRHINGVPVKSDKDIVITIYDDSIKKKNTANTSCSSALSYDIIGDQLIPVARTGKEYIIVKGAVTNVLEPNCPADGGERIFITSTEPNTDITIDGLYITTLPLAGQVFSFPVETRIIHVLASKPVYVIHLTGFGGELGGAVVPSLDNSPGSEKAVFSRSPNVGDAFQMNLVVRNTSDFFHINSIDAFTVIYDGGWTSIPNTFFEYIADSSYIVLKKTPEVTAFVNNMITPGTEAVIENSVTGFQLGIVSGGATTGCKYGYVSDFSPKPVKEIMQSKDSLEVIISSKIFDGDWDQDEWLILKITDTVTNIVWYDSTAIVTKAHGFRDTIYLDSGIYKCEIIDMGANVEMPVIKVDDDHIIPWGYPEYEYYLFTIPGVYNTENTIWRTACDSLVSPSGEYTWFCDGVYYDTIPNSEGFDSLLTVNLIINNSSSAELTETACFSYVSPSGILIENSGIYHEVIPNSAGCDSNITINLTIVTVDNTVETIAGTMMAVEDDATYQWLACPSGLDIGGAIGQLYTPIVTGLYAVRITKDGCTVTSYCNPMTSAEAYQEVELTYYPNPVTDELFIDLKGFYGTIELRIDDMAGRTMLIKEYAHQDRICVDTKNLSTGIYFVRLIADGKHGSFKIVK